jgi:hypothetical protein
MTQGELLETPRDPPESRGESDSGADFRLVPA